MIAGAKQKLTPSEMSSRIPPVVMFLFFVDLEVESVQVFELGLRPTYQRKLLPPE